MNDRINHENYIDSYCNNDYVGVIRDEVINCRTGQLCPICGGDIYKDNIELYCSKCGLVIE